MLTIPANDHGLIRVFETATKPESIEKLFGADLDQTYVDIVRINDLGDMTLSDYVSQGYDIEPDAVDATALNGVGGYAVLILSRASRGEETILTFAEGLRHVTTCGSAIELVPPQSLPDASAKGVIETAPPKPSKSDARIGGMVATVALLLLFALVGLMVWVSS